MKTVLDSDFDCMQRVFDQCHATAIEKGWWDGYGGRELTPDEKLAKLMLVVTEVAENAEAIRNAEELYWEREDGKPEGMFSELADVVIRCADLAGQLESEWPMLLSQAIKAKMTYNEKRPYKHGKVV